MQFLKSSLVLLILTVNNPSWSFTGDECLKSSFETKITHKGELFGLIEHEFSIKKERCLIKVGTKKIFEKFWLIDVCREPIHIKVESKGGLTVYKREGLCQIEEEPSEFCIELMEIMNIMQDDGLIFAQGERSNIGSSHGQVYCSYLLSKNYLEPGLVFGPDKSNINIFEGKKDSCEVEPEKNKKMPSQKLPGKSNDK